MERHNTAMGKVTTNDIKNMSVTIMTKDGRGFMAPVPNSYISMVATILSGRCSFVEVDGLVETPIKEIAKQNKH